MLHPVKIDFGTPTSLTELTENFSPFALLIGHPGHELRILEIVL